MVFDKTPLSREQANAVLTKWLGRPVNCESTERLHGGMVNSVLRLEFDADPFTAVIKVSSKVGQGAFREEAAALRYLRDEAGFPVPLPLLCESDGQTIPVSFLLLEFMPGCNLGEAPLRTGDRRRIDRQMAAVLADLHEHRRGTYGRAARPENEGKARWVDVFGPMIRDNYEAIAGRIDNEGYRVIGKLLDRLEELFESSGPPTLVHGDIWATNVIVDRGSGQWDLVGFVDPGALYADVEYELAYLEVFSTVSDDFFTAYSRRRPLREGYRLRRLIYWLNTMMLHVDHFGDAHYARNTEQLARALARAVGVD